MLVLPSPVSAAQHVAVPNLGLSLQVAALLHIIDDSLEQTSLKVQEAAAACLHNILNANHHKIPDDRIKKYCNLLSGHVQCRRIAGALALAVIPPVMIQDAWSHIFQHLCVAIDSDTATETEDVDARAAAIKACDQCRTLLALSSHA